MQGFVEQSRTIGRVHTRRRARGEHAGQQPRHLAALLETRAFVLHGAPIGHGLPAIDHLAVGSAGVWIVASRRALLGRVQLRRSLVSAPKLLVGSTDHTELLDLLDRQRKVVCAALADEPDVPIRTAVCFAGGRFPFLGTLISDGHLVLPPDDLVGHVGGSGPLSRAEARWVAALLDSRLG